jgi:hypothetical protein
MGISLLLVCLLIKVCSIFLKHIRCMVIFVCFTDEFASVVLTSLPKNIKAGKR